MFSYVFQGELSETTRQHRSNVPALCRMQTANQHFQTNKTKLAQQSRQCLGVVVKVSRRVRQQIVGDAIRLIIYLSNRLHKGRVSSHPGSVEPVRGRLNLSATRALCQVVWPNTSVLHVGKGRYVLRENVSTFVDASVTS